VVLRAVSTNPQNVRGVILVSAGVRPHLHNPLNMSSDFLKGMASIFQPVDLTEYISRYCSEDPRVVNEMLHDPLGKNRQSALDLFGTFQFLKQEPQFASMMPPVIPVLAIQGTVDQVVEPDSINDLMNALPTKQKQLLMVPNCGHVIVGTSFLKPMVVTAITSFLQEHKTRGSVAPSAEPAALGHSVGEHSLVNPSDFSGGNSGNGRSNRDTPATN
jgi:alpha-beta hydrolase superfamily lysophospholipase